MTRFIVLVLSLLASGCWVNRTIVTRPEHIDEINRICRVRTSTITLDVGETAGDSVTVGTDSVRWLDTTSRARRSAPLTSLKSLSCWERGKALGPGVIVASALAVVTKLGFEASKTGGGKFNPGLAYTLVAGALFTVATGLYTLGDAVVGGLHMYRIPPAVAHILSGPPENADNRDLLLHAIREDGTLLRHASPRLRDDSLLVSEAVSRDPDALQFASDRLRDDKEFVLSVVRENGMALRWASDRLRDDPDVVIEAALGGRDALEFASKRLQRDAGLLRHLSSRGR